ncbi:alpha-mannosidase [uncultured Microbacterium sp.]|uniref:alpha-mannosidase n=1 Tax=uncultured Microbacterium sp. TaxID=191216 RepID=UPI0035CBA8AD
MIGFTVELIGFPAQHPREYRRLLSIRKRIYTPVAGLKAEILRSGEPIPFEAIDRAAFRSLRPGTSWGTVGDCAWLRITGEMAASGAELHVMLGIRGEGLVFSPDGVVLDSVSTVWQQGDLPHSGGKYRSVRDVDLSSGRIELYADVAYNGFLLYEVGSAVYHGAHIATRDDEMFALYYDMLTLSVLAVSTKDQSLAWELRTALDAAYRRFEVGDTAGARAALAPSLAAPSESNFVYTAIGHGHLDMAWLWPLRETHRKAARTYSRALGNIARTESFVYGTSQPQQLQWMKEEQPALFERLRAAAGSGRMELQGSFWVEPDTNLPNGESLVRQALVGRRFLQEEFALDADELRMCWLPDTFGYSGNLPQILKKSGMDWFSTIKLAWNKVNTFPHRTFHWEGIDGSSVLVHMPPEGDYNARGAADGLLKGIDQYPERDLGTALLVYGSGDGGGGPGEVHLEVTQRETNLRGLPRIEFGSATSFFRRLETMDVAHTHVGELYLETHQGTYTTQARIKRMNRLVERKLHNAESLAAIVGSDTRGALAPIWRDVLLGQFHDIIPGSSIERVNREAVATYQRLDGELDEHIGGLVAELPIGQDGTTVLNLTSFPRSEHIAIDGEWFYADAAPYASATVHLAQPVPELAFTPDTTANGILTLHFAESGEISSCTDSQGNELAGAGLNRLVVHDDPFQFPFDAWDIGMDYLDKPLRVLSATDVRTRIDGPTVVRSVLYRYPKVFVEQSVILEAGSDVVRFDTVVTWREKHKMLRAEFRPEHYGQSVQCEIQFGHISRPTTERDSVERAQFEICAHKWIATNDGVGGFALLNDSKYGHRAKDGLISLNLLRSPTFPDKTADRGIHRFTYAFTPYAPNDLAKVIREGYRLNNPLLVTGGADLAPFAATDDPAIVIETIKPAESGSGIVLRLYESLGRPAVTRLCVARPYAIAREANLMEIPLGDADLDRLEFTPFEIKTIHLEG